jgi:hypothetical protein
MSADEYTIEVQQDFVERQSCAQPIPALAEIIWNAVDADATAVNVEFEDDGLGGMSKIIVSDNGHGIPRTEASTASTTLPNSARRPSPISLKIEPRCAAIAGSTSFVQLHQAAVTSDVRGEDGGELAFHERALSALHEYVNAVGMSSENAGWKGECLSEVAPRAPHRYFVRALLPSH